MKDLLLSERSSYCLIVLVIATVLALLRVIDGSQWVAVAGTLIGFLVSSKTASHYIQSKTGTSPPTA